MCQWHVWTLKYFNGLLWAVRVPPRSTIKDVCTPVAAGAALHVIAVGRWI